MRYGDAAQIWRINLGWRQRKNPNERGYLLDLERGYWATNKDAEEADREDPLSGKIKRVVPYVEDHRNVLTIHFDVQHDLTVMASLQAAFKQGIQHPGFSFLDVFSPCVTYNHDNTYQWFRSRVKKLEEEPAYDPTDWMAAMEKSLLWGDTIPIGRFFERTDVSTLHGAEPVLDEGPLIHRDLRVPPDIARSFIEELM